MSQVFIVWYQRGLPQLQQKVVLLGAVDGCQVALAVVGEELPAVILGLLPALGGTEETVAELSEAGPEGWTLQMDISSEAEDQEERYARNWPECHDDVRCSLA